MEEPRALIGFDLSMASPEVIEVLLEDVSEVEIFENIARENAGRPEILRLVYEHPDTPEEARKLAAGFLHLPARPASSHPQAGPGRTAEARRETLTTKIQKLNVSARVQLALKGGREIRGILARDPSKEVILSVLENGKITESEVELIAKSRNICEEALRKVSKNREWTKKYAISFGLATNPKTPPGIAVTLVSGLKTKDIILLEKNKNVSEAVRLAARKLAQARKSH